MLPDEDEVDIQPFIPQQFKSSEDLPLAFTRLKRSHAQKTWTGANCSQDRWGVWRQTLRGIRAFEVSTYVNPCALESRRPMNRLLGNPTIVSIGSHVFGVQIAIGRSDHGQPLFV
ncbi:MAG: hypothetical protein U5J82_09380 [Desulfobacterales bacterium]|nr:hypothetical protein [Desulfobacterales bacterium]